MKDKLTTTTDSFQYTGFWKKTNLHTLELCGVSNISTQLRKEVKARMWETTILANDVLHLLGYEGFDCSIKLLRGKIAFDFYLNVDWNFVDHDLMNYSDFSLFLKELIRELNRRPEVGSLPPGKI